MENSALKSLPLRFTFRSKLFLGLGAIGLLILTLLALANRVIQEAFHHLQETRTQHLGPLVDINNLQTQINRIYSLEIELTRSLDYFAVTTQLETLSSESQLFTKQLSHFLDGHQARDTLDMQRLGLYWKGYQADLQRIQKHAARMETEQVLHISTYESFPRFTNITRTLQRIANDTETEASKIFDHAIDHHHQLRRTFLVAAAIGFAFYVAYMFFFLRSLSHRLSRLTDGAARLSEGRAEQPIEVQGNDELTELAIAFNAMQQEVAFRENALREAGGQLEHRVNLRTHELQETNKRLSNEVEERRRAEQALRLLSLAVEQSPVSVMITDTRGRIEYVNNAFVKISGYSPKEAVGETPALLKSGLTSRETYRDLWSTIARGSDWEGELHNRKRDGSLYWEHARISPVKNVDGEITHYLSVQEDVTLRREHEAKIAFQAQYDALTELPNRALAIDRLSQTIHHAVRTSCRVALMFIDLDDFKKINDSLGHEIGDELLVQASKRLRQAVRKEDTVARHGGDEFLVIMGDLSDVSDSKNLVSKILNAFAPPFTVSGYDLVVTPSIGLAVFPDDGGDPNTLLRNADLAMYQAKSLGRNTFQFFTQEIHDYSLRRLEMERYLRGALERDEMRVFFQPLVETTTSQIVGAEALIRWESAEIGWVMPDGFIEIAENTGLICPIGDWILLEACRQVQKWRNQRGIDFHLSVNVSPRQFLGRSIVESVRRALQMSGFPANQLHLEVTEGLLIRNRGEARETLGELKDMGIRLVLDDFGTGYSSLSYLKSFPFHSMKIDRSFINDITTNSDTRALVNAAVTMGKSLGLEVVAEGVETQEQLVILRQMGCSLAQGYYFSKPQAAEEFQRDWILPQLRPAGSAH